MTNYNPAGIKQADIIQLSEGGDISGTYDNLAQQIFDEGRKAERERIIGLLLDSHEALPGIDWDARVYLIDSVKKLDHLTPLSR